MRLCIASRGVAGSAAISRRRIATSQQPLFDIEKFKARKIPALYEAFHPTPSSLLNWSLSGFLPLRMGSQDQMFDRGSAYEGARPKRLPYGHHLLYFHPRISDMELMDDGTDMLHAPDRSWKYRLWAGGSMEWPSGRSLKMSGAMCILRERIADVKLKDGNEKAFVKIERHVHQLNRGTVSGLLETRANSDFLEGKLSSGIPDILETRWLCFTRDPPFAKGTGTKLVEPPSNPYDECTMTATPSLLLRFSALTFNAHKIHVDPEFARKAYALPNTVVHGPLTIILMTTFLKTMLDKRLINHKPAGRKPEIDLPAISTFIEKLEYKNISPIYAGEEITLACKPLKPVSSVQEIVNAGPSEYLAETWQIWIEKKQNGKRTVAATCTATLRLWQPLERRAGATHWTPDRSVQDEET